MINKFLLLFILTSFVGFTQTIRGKIQNKLKEPISVNIIIKNSENKNLISEFFKSDDNGEYNFELKKNYSIIFLEITSLGFQKISDSIINPIKSKIYTFEYVMQNKNFEMEEVIIKKEKFEIKEDTVSFNPSLYKDGTERKVEDLIKKLPGMEVESNGTIKYRGKKVTAVQLEGDDIFGNNYAIGTRNISVDMVQQIQAINNYSENPLLKGIENSDAIAINIKLKKGKFNISGDNIIGSGLNSLTEAQNDIGINLLGISKKIKSFQNLSYNNIGNNRSTEDYFGLNVSLDQLQKEEYKTKKAISENSNSTIFNPEIANINNQLAISHNSILRILPKLSLNTTVSFINDKLFNIEKNNVFFNDGNINYNDESENIKKPENKQIELKLLYNTSKISLLELETNFQKENNNIFNSITQNQDLSFDTNLFSENLFWKNRLKFTYKISKNKAIQYLTVLSNNSINQEMNISQTSFSFGGNKQKSNFKKNYISNTLFFIGSIKQLKYNFTIASVLDFNTMNSELNENNVNFFSFENRFNYRKSIFFSDIGITYVKNNFKFQPKLKLSLLNQEYDNETTNKYKKSIIINPNLNIFYSFNNKSTVNIFANYDEKTPSEDNLYTNFISQSNRVILRNNLSLNLQQIQNYSLNYRYNDLFTSFAANISLLYENKKNTYLSLIEIQNDYTLYTFFQSPTNIENYFLNFGAEKYFNFIKSTLKHSSSFGFNSYKNIINQSELRNNKSLTYNAYFFISSTFRFPLNFQSKFNYNIVSFKSDNQNSILNLSLNNSSKLLYKPSRNWLFTFSYDYYLPNSKRIESFTFLDFEVKFKPKKLKWVEFWLTGKNLLNRKFYYQNENSDFQTSTYQSSLLPRYYLLTMDFKL